MNTREMIYKAIQTADINHPIKRSELMELTGLSDRMVRANVENLRGSGVRICSTPHDSGYWLSGSSEEYINFRKCYLSPEHKKYKTVAAMDRNLPGQIGI